MLDGWCIYPAYLIIIKELAEEFKGQFTCLGENTERYITFSILTKNEVTRINKKEEKVTKTISYRLQFIDSARFMIRTFSSLVNNLAKGIHETKSKYGHDSKKCETCRIKYKDCEYCIEYANVKDDLIVIEYIYVIIKTTKECLMKF